MKFGQKLKANAVGQWRDYYIDYKNLKRLLKKFEPVDTDHVPPSALKVFVVPQKKPEKSPSVKLLDSAAIEEEDGESFVLAVKFEVEKVDNFYQEECARIKERLDFLSADLKRNPSSSSFQIHLHEDDTETTDTEPNWKTMDSVRRATVELYREMMLLQNFTQLNHTAVIKIMKKYKKLSKNDQQATTALQQFVAYSYVKATELLADIDEVENLFRVNFTQGNLTNARAQLLAKQRIDYDWKMFHSGVHFGIVFLLLVWVLWDCIVDRIVRPSNHVAWDDQSFMIYRGLSSFVLLIWCWGMNIFVWDKARINFLYIMELDSRNTQTYSDIFHFACNCTIFFLASFLLFNKIQRGDFPDWIPPVYFPVGTFIVFALLFIFPLHKRMFLISTLGRVLCSPFTPVNFFASYAADVLTSLVKPLVDMAFAICFLFSGEWSKDESETSPGSCLSNDTFKFVVTPLVIAFPLFIRLMQCLRRYKDTHNRWPHLGNAGKYSVAQSVVLFGAFHPSFKSNAGDFTIFQSMWVVSLILSTLYTYSWDVKMDWGLLQTGCKGLRSKTMFSQRWVYYAAIIVDFFLRFTWTLTLLPNSFIPFIRTSPTLFDLFIALLEVLRRTMWGCFRVEWEHLANTEQYRRVDFIPLHFNLSHKEGPKFKGWRVAIEMGAIGALVLAVAIGAAISK